ncbi:EboA domain-containing protein [Streptomyces sp. NPDC093589]|uniref:EboA domain-containing protein n=1 Tax=Streptomyces sp. NPDC093589 TaxID=3366043 RepID=UPI0037F9C94A
MVTAPDERLTRLHTALLDRLDAPARSWLTESLDGARADGRRPAAPEGPTAPLPTWELRFAAAGRHCTRREPPHTADPEAAEAARVLLLHAARADARTVTRLYGHGTAAERRAVLGALPYLTLDAQARPLVEDALRTHDTRLVAAAVGPYAARHLDQHAWRHAVLKCLFTDVPVAAVAELARRAAGDAELSRMLRAYARERSAAGRPVPDDLHRVLDLTRASPPGSPP